MRKKVERCFQLREGDRLAGMSGPGESVCASTSTRASHRRVDGDLPDVVERRGRALTRCQERRQSSHCMDVDAGWPESRRSQIGRSGTSCLHHKFAAGHSQNDPLCRRSILYSTVVCDAAPLRFRDIES